MGRVVEESDLDLKQFHCCGDEDLYPFGCPGCGRPMVFCYECDILFSDLNDLSDQDTEVNHSRIQEPIFTCPWCGNRFSYFFIRDGLYKVPRELWVAAGFGHLLRGEIDA